jgi:hypothetical protein
MRILLASLMCLVLTSAECFALKGGPVFEGSKATTTGTYAGVFMPTQGSNSLALFTLQIAQIGIGSGTLVIFDAGQIYSGTLQATGDPNKGKVTGLVRATFPYIITVPSGTDSNGNPTFTTTTVVAVAAGTMQAKVKVNNQFSGVTSTRLTGTADVEFSLTVNHPFDEIIYDIIGFKQSST